MIQSVPVSQGYRRNRLYTDPLPHRILSFLPVPAYAEPRDGVVAEAVPEVTYRQDGCFPGAHFEHFEGIPSVRI